MNLKFMFVQQNRMMDEFHKSKKNRIWQANIRHGYVATAAVGDHGPVVADDDEMRILLGIPPCAVKPRGIKGTNLHIFYSKYSII